VCNNLGNIYLITGNGAGKTTSAIGLALRALGHNKKVTIIQFLKWNEDTGEMLFTHPNYRIYQFGRNGWHGFKNINNIDVEIVNKGISFMIDILESNCPDLLILDESNLIVFLKLISAKSLINKLREYMIKNTNLNIILTGRHATEELIGLVDYANEVKELKTLGYVCEEGIQY
jgi:cob(I)alamin adenosyltransferase